MIQVLPQQWQRIPYTMRMYNTKFVQKLAFAYRNCPLTPFSLETTKHFQAYINSLL